MKLTRQDWVLGVVVTVFVVLFSYLSLAQYAGLKTQLNDLGNVAQPVWNTLNGRFMQMSNNYGVGFEFMNRLGGHANFIYLLAVPLYGLWSDPRLLLLIQVLLSGLAAVPVYWLGQRLVGKRSWLALAAPTAYLVNPVLHDAVLYDVHAIVWALPFLTGAVYFLLSDKYKWLAASAVLLALCKEDMPLVVFMLGLYEGLVRGKRKSGLIISLVSLTYFLSLITFVMPTLAPDAARSFIEDRYAGVGGSPVGLVGSLVTSPGLVVGGLLDKGVVSYVAMMLVGFVGLPLVSGLSVLALPTLAVNLLSSNLITYQPLGYYYPAPIIGVGAVASVMALARLRGRKMLGFSQGQVGVGLVLVALVFSFMYSGAPYSRVSSWAEFEVGAHARGLSGVKALIPDSASLTVQNNLGPHFANRVNVVNFPHRTETSDFVLVDVTDPFLVVRAEPRQRNFIHIVQMFPEEYLEAVEELFDDGELGVVYIKDGYLLFGRGFSQEKNESARVEFEKRARVLLERYDSVGSQPQIN